MKEHPVNSTVELTWLGQMGLLIRMGDTMICVDYFATPTEDRLIAPPVKADELVGIDAFLGTHNHLDHIDHEAWKIWAKTSSAILIGWLRTLNITIIRTFFRRL